MTKEVCLKQKLAEMLPKEQEQFIGDEHFYYFHHQDAFYRVRRFVWNEIFARHKAETDVEHDEVVGLGGLHIVGTERHESRRIDNQLRGRAGRQGDPGSSRFYLSLQDDLLRIFGGQRMQNLMLRLGMEEDVPIESKLITKRIAAAQKAVETQNFEARKHLLEYDDVMNKQRQAVYGIRRQLLEGQDQKERVLEMVRGIVRQFVDMRAPENAHPTTWDFTGLRTDVLSQFGQKIDPAQISELSRAEMEDFIFEQLERRYQEKEDLVGPEIMRQTERMIMLQVIDDQWKDHLLSMDHLKEGIGLRGYGQKDPLVEYKKESFVIFQDMMDRIEDETVRYLFFLQVQREDDRHVAPVLPFPVDEDEEEEPEPLPVAGAQRAAAQTSLQDFTRKIERKKEREMAELQFVGGDGSTANKPVVQGQKVGRNDPCPCGSGKKYKKCHGA
jgi:preprotein translocase subunit SecA